MRSKCWLEVVFEADWPLGKIEGKQNRSAARQMSADYGECLGESVRKDRSVQQVRDLYQGRWC